MEMWVHRASAWRKARGQQLVLSNQGTDESPQELLQRKSRGLTPVMCSSAALRKGSHPAPAGDGFTGVSWRGLKLAGQRELLQVGDCHLQQVPVLGEQ